MNSLTTATTKVLYPGECEVVMCDAVLGGKGNIFVDVDPDDKIAYCWHPKLRILVGGSWWCQWWEKIE